MDCLVTINHEDEQKEQTGDKGTNQPPINHHHHHHHHREAKICFANSRQQAARAQQMARHAMHKAGRAHAAQGPPAACPLRRPTAMQPPFTPRERDVGCWPEREQRRRRRGPPRSARAAWRPCWQTPCAPRPPTGCCRGPRTAGRGRGASERRRKRKDSLFFFF